ncbi:MAG: hypothetical protein ACI9HE_002406 [Planctomycetota bacterium]|jgi:hypothetical protein
MKALAALLVFVVALVLFLMPGEEGTATLTLQPEPELEQQVRGLEPALLEAWRPVGS